MQCNGGIGSNVFNAQPLKVNPINQDSALIRVVQPQQHGHERRLPRPSRTNDRRDGADIGNQIKGLEYRATWFVSEIDPAPLKLLDRDGKRFWVIRAFHFGFKVENKKGPFQRDEEILKLAPHSHRTVALPDGSFCLLTPELKCSKVPGNEWNQENHDGGYI